MTAEVRAMPGGSALHKMSWARRMVSSRLVGAFRRAPGQSKHNAVSAAPVPPGIAGAWLFLPDCCDLALFSSCAERGRHERLLVNAPSLSERRHSGWSVAQERTADHSCQHQDGDRGDPRQCEPAAQRAEEAQQRHHGAYPAGPDHPLRQDPGSHPADDVPAMSVAIPTKAKRYTQPDSVSDTKPNCASL